jgi:spore germination protein KA
MELSFEGLREAGVRLPRPVGQAVSIVGALVIGQAAVTAGLVSAPMVIVVAITGIASFIIPSFGQAIAIRMLRFPIMILAGSLGLYGILLAILLIFSHMCRLRSFGIPYLSPMAPLHLGDIKDVLVRAPWWSMINRQEETAKGNPQRMNKSLRSRRSKRTK